MCARQVEWPEAAYAVHPSVNKVFDAAAVRLKYSSLVTPSMTSMYSVTDRELTTLKGIHRVLTQSSCAVGYPTAGSSVCERCERRRRDVSCLR
jgi:hypothetical protein